MCCGGCGKKETDRYIDGFKDGLALGGKNVSKAFKFGYDLGVEHYEKGLLNSEPPEEFVGKEPNYEDFNAGYRAGYEQGFDDGKELKKEKLEKSLARLEKFMNELEYGNGKVFKRFEVVWVLDFLRDELGLENPLPF